MNSTRWTQAEDQLLTVHYPAGDVDALAQRLGRPRRGLYQRANQLGIKRTVRASSPYILRALVMAARPDGVRASEIGHPDITLAGNIMTRLMNSGQLFRAVLGRRTVHYFTTQKAAAGFYKAHFAEHQARVAKHMAKPSRRAVWDADAPLVFTANTKYTIAPPPPAMVWRTNTHAR